MKVAVIENNLKDYIIDVFNKQEKKAYELLFFAEWQPKTEHYSEISIESIEQIENEDYDVLLIAIKENRYLSRLLTYLHNKKMTRVYVVRLFAMDMKANFLEKTGAETFNPTYMDSIPEGDEKPYLVHLETHVCDHCNLNCKACNNFAPFVKEPTYADLNQFEEDLKNLKRLFSAIGRFFLLGGEPLLAPELCCDMIRMYRKYYPTNELRVLTNATLILSMKDVFWNCLRENNVIIHISLYPPVKERISEIRQRLEEEKVKYLVFREVKTFAKHWTAYPFEDEKYNNERCGSAGCHYLRNGEISKCPDAILVDFMAEGREELSGLKLNDRVKLTEETDAWKLIERIDEPIDLCKKCTFKRLEGIKWEHVEEEAQLSDWLLPHRYEAEVVQLKCSNEKANSEIDNLKRSNEKANSEIDNLKRENERVNREIVILNKKGESQNQEIRALNEKIKSKDSEMEESKSKISLYEKREKVLEKEQNIWKQKYNDADASLKEVQQEYERIKNSYSNKIGRWITWVPRIARRVLKKIIQKYRNTLFYGIWRHFSINILEGYSIYKQIIVKYGISVKIYHTAGGAGDVYFCGLFFREYLMKKHGYEIPVFTVTRESGRKVAQLFSIENIEVVPYSKRKNLVNMVIFLGSPNVRYEIIHHNPISVHTSVSRFMETIHGMCTADILKETVYSGLTPSTIPLYEEDVHYIDFIFERYNLKRKKTVLLAPYANSTAAIPILFWENIVQKLINAGFSVLTNSQGAKERAIKGTYSITIPIKNIVPFLNEAGYLVGIRSGLFDFTEHADIKRVIFYPQLKEQGRGAGGWNNSSYLHFSFNQWYERIDAFELEYFSDSEPTLIDKVLEFLKGELKNGYIKNEKKTNECVSVISPDNSSKI